MFRRADAAFLILAAALPACAPAERASRNPAPPPAPVPVTLEAADTAALPEAPPGTDIFLVDLETHDGVPQPVGPPVPLVARAGYDNQPSFTPDGDALLITSIREDEQADIYRVDLPSGAITQISRTPESEYSPTVMPGGGQMSVVRVEADSTQRLWAFDLDGSNPRLILENVAPVGYHAWGDPNTLALFVLGDPPTLQLADIRTGTAKVVAENVGRSLHKVPGRNAISFVEKASDNEWWIRELDLATREITPLVRTLTGAEDYAWMPDGTLLMAQGSRLHAWQRGDAEWTEIADWAAAGLRNITRLAVSPGGDRLAVVADGPR